MKLTVRFAVTILTILIITNIHKQAAEAADFEIVSANLLDDDPRRVSDRIVYCGLSIDPLLGPAGMTEAQVRQSDRRALIGRKPMANIGSATEKGETQGFMKILVDAYSAEILGAAILGVGGDEAILSILDIMYAKQPYTVIKRAMHIHPTVSELIPTVLGDLRIATSKKKQSRHLWQYLVVGGDIDVRQLRRNHGPLGGMPFCVACTIPDIYGSTFFGAFDFFR